MIYGNYRDQVTCQWLLVSGLNFDLMLGNRNLNWSFCRQEISWYLSDTHTSLEIENDPSKWISVKLITFFVIWGSKFFLLKKLLFNFLRWINFIMSVGLKTHLDDAQKRKEQEQANYAQKIVRWFFQLMIFAIAVVFYSLDR